MLDLFLREKFRRFLEGKQEELEEFRALRQFARFNFSYFGKDPLVF